MDAQSPPSESQAQACPILTTCSSRESGDSTRTSRISSRQRPTQLARVAQLVQVVEVHLIKRGRGPVNSYESRLSFVL